MADHVLRDVDRHRVTRALAPQVLHIVDDWIGHLPVRRGEHFERNSGVGLFPKLHKAFGFLRVN